VALIRSDRNEVLNDGNSLFDNCDLERSPSFRGLVLECLGSDRDEMLEKRYGLGFIRFFRIVQNGTMKS
jgi:hypothetical protein